MLLTSKLVVYKCAIIMCKYLIYRQIGKWMKDNMPEVQHLYDIWHVAKTFKKKLMAAAKKRNCEDLQPWIRSINRHLYWCATSTEDDEEEMRRAKWESLLAHIKNVHEHFGEPFPKCLHGPLEGREAKKLWLKPRKYIMLCVNYLVL